MSHELLNRTLTPQEKAELRAKGGTVGVSTTGHYQGRTYGGNNNPTQISADAANPERAIDKDIDRHVRNGTIDAEDAGRIKSDLKGMIGRIDCD